MRPLKQVLLLAAPTLLVLAGVEVGLRTVLPAAEFPIAIFDGRYGVLRYDVRRPRTGLYTLGLGARPRVRWRINDAGWNSAIEYSPRPAPGRRRIAVIGDSYVEAVQVDLDRNVGAVLRKRLAGEAEVVTVGISGAPLSQYVQLARYATRALGADVLVINVVHNDFDQSVRTLTPLPMFLQYVPDGAGVREVAPRAYPPSAVRRLLRHSALFRYLVWNGRVGALPAVLSTAARAVRRGDWPGDRRPGAVPNANTDPERLRREAPVIRRVVHAVVATLRAEHPGMRIVLMMDAPRRDIYAGTLATSSVGWLTSLVREEAAAHGCELVDLTPVFARDWAMRHRSLEFPSDFHWNADAHRLAAEALLAELRRAPPASAPRPTS